MISSRWLSYSLLFSACMVGSSHAQSVEQDEQSSAFRQETEEHMHYEPQSAATLGVGGAIGVKYNDNIYRTPANIQSDLIGVVAPTFRVRTDIKPYDLRLDGKIESGQYFDQTDNSYNDADLKAKIGYDLDDISTIYADGRFSYDHIDVGGFVDDPQALAEEPTTYRYMEAGTGWALDSSSWIGLLDLRTSLYDYDNIDRNVGNKIINDDRDFDQQDLTARAGYKFWPMTAAYVEGQVNQRNYGKRIDTSLNQARDSDGYGLFTGVAYGTPRDIWFADAAVGYLQQNYDNAGLPQVEVPALRALVQWQPDETLCLRGDISRDIREVALLNVSSYLQSRIRLRGEYTFLPQWTVGGGVRYTENDFQINPTVGLPSRLDTVWDQSLYLDYAIAPEYSLGGELMNVSRSSDDSRAEYDANVAMLRAKVNY